MTIPPGAQERAKTANECLGNRIMALRDTRCETYRHYLCDVCAGQWIADAIAQAVQGELEARDNLVRDLRQHLAALGQILDANDSVTALPTREKTDEQHTLCSGCEDLVIALQKSDTARADAWAILTQVRIALDRHSFGYHVEPFIEEIDRARALLEIRFPEPGQPEGSA